MKLLKKASTDKRKAADIYFSDNLCVEFRTLVIIEEFY